MLTRGFGVLPDSQLFGQVLRLPKEFALFFKGPACVVEVLPF